MIGHMDPLRHYIFYTEAVSHGSIPSYTCFISAPCGLSVLACTQLFCARVYNPHTPVLMLLRVHEPFQAFPLFDMKSEKKTEGEAKPEDPFVVRTKFVTASGKRVLRSPRVRDGVYLHI